MRISLENGLLVISCKISEGFAGVAYSYFYVGCMCYVLLLILYIYLIDCLCFLQIIYVGMSVVDIIHVAT